MTTDRSRRIVLVLAIVALLGVSDQANAATVAAPSTFPYQHWTDVARAPTPDVAVTVTEQACPWFDGSTGCTDQTGSIWIAPGQDKRVTRVIFLHELGHQLDYASLDDSERAAFQAMLRIPPEAAWSRDEWNSDSPAEVFAQTYALCALHREDGGHWRYPTGRTLTDPVTGAQVGPKRVGTLCDFIDLSTD